MISTGFTKRWITCGFLSVYILTVYGQYTVEPDRSIKQPAQQWHLERLCGQTIFTHGGVLNFDSTQLRGAGCSIYITGLGANDTMLSLYFVYLNISDGCPANVTLTEPQFQTESRKGLSLSYCKTNPNLNQNSMFTTLGDTVVIQYRRTASSNTPVVVKFVMKISAFTSRRGGCSENEINERGMTSCESGRCVHTSLLCKELNPCGNDLDCENSTHSKANEDGVNQGLEFVKVTVIIVVVVFGLFAIIQVCLIVRNNKKVCGWHGHKDGDHTRDGASIEAEFLPVQYGDKESRKNHKDTSIEATFITTESASNHR